MTHLDPPFSARHIGPAPEQVAQMLATVGYGSVDDLMDVAIPEAIRFHGRLGLPPAATEAEAIAELRALAAQNAPRVSMIGLCYDEIARALGLELGTVRSRLHRARMDLKEKMERFLS